MIDDILKEVNDFLGDKVPESEKKEFFNKLSVMSKDRDLELVIPLAPKKQPIIEMPDKIEIKNFKELADEVGKAISIPKIEFPNFPQSFEVSNLDQIQFPNRMEISNFPSVQQVEIINQQEFPSKFDISLDKYTKPTNPIAVRLADGKYFKELADLIGEKIVIAGGIGGSKEVLVKEINHGNLTTSSGSALPLSVSEVFCRTVSLQSHPENQGYIYIGSVDVSPESYGAIIQPGEPKDIEIDDISKIYVSSDYNNERVSWMIVR